MAYKNNKLNDWKNERKFVYSKQLQREQSKMEEIRKTPERDVEEKRRRENWKYY